MPRTANYNLRFICRQISDSSPTKPRRSAGSGEFPLLDPGIRFSLKSSAAAAGILQYNPRMEGTNGGSVLDQKSLSHKNSTFWLDTGSLVLQVQDNLFKVHGTLLDSRVISTFIAQSSAVNTIDSCPLVVIDLPGLRVQDMEALLGHLYHRM